MRGLRCEQLERRILLSSLFALEEPDVPWQPVNCLDDELSEELTALVDGQSVETQLSTRARAVLAFVAENVTAMQADQVEPTAYVTPSVEYCQKFDQVVMELNDYFEGLNKTARN